jgi:A/G-specific adenine glycosylase
MHPDRPSGLFIPPPMRFPDQPTVPAPASLGQWFARNRRDLPWRTPAGVPRDPWQTLVSEVMSQQTRLEVVVPRFREWMARFPTPADLAKAPEDAVLAAWAGMGYYSRARNLRKAALRLTENGWPSTSLELAALPGIGPYTAAAIASLAFGERVAMVDGNVQRVLSRFFALAADPRSGAGARRIAQLATAWVSGGDAGVLNEATMELGAMVCSPRNPSCPTCPLMDLCRAASLGEPEKYPPPKARPEKVSIRRTVVVAQDSTGVILRLAAPDELLSGLWILPSVGDHPGLEVLGSPLGEVCHSITHHDVRWTVVGGDWKGATVPDGWISCPRQELSQRVVSSLLRKALALAGIGL